MILHIPSNEFIYAIEDITNFPEAKEQRAFWFALNNTDGLNPSIYANGLLNQWFVPVYVDTKKTSKWVIELIIKHFERLNFKTYPSEYLLVKINSKTNKINIPNGI